MSIRTVVGLAVVALAIAVACDSDDGDAAEDATATATTAVTATATAPADTATATAAVPRTTRDLLGRETTIAAVPQRIVAASPSAIEILYAAGGQAVARSETARFPAAVTGLPSIGPSYQPSFEIILELEPDLVLADASAQAHLAEAFTQALPGVPVVFVGAVAYDDIATSIRLVGQLLGTEEQAELAAAEMEGAKSDVAAATAGLTAPRVLVLNGAPDDFFVALPDSFVGDLVRLANGDNVAAGLPAGGPFPGYTQLSLEAVVGLDPEVITTITAGPPGGPTLADGVRGNPVFAGLTAVQTDRVFELDLETFLQAPGPRAADGLRQLAAQLHGSE